MAKRAKQERLPHTANAIPELEQLGYEYASARDERMKWLGKETDLKDQLHKAMKQHKLETYKYEDLEIYIEKGEETVRVRVSKARKQQEAEKAAAADSEKTEDAGTVH